MPQIFIAFSYRDQDQFEDLSMHLMSLKRQRLISGWIERRIDKDDPQDRIQPELTSAMMVLLLVTPGLIATSYFDGAEFKLARERHQRGQAQLVPILVRPVDLDASPFSGLHILPSDAKPISKWRDSDEAWLDVVKGIKQILNSVTPNEYRAHGEDRNGNSASTVNANALAKDASTRGSAPMGADNRTLNRAELRRLIDQVLRTSSDLDAFCLDFFPETYRRFSGGMERTSRINILFESVDTEDVTKALRQHDPIRFARYQEPPR